MKFLDPFDPDQDFTVLVLRSFSFSASFPPDILLPKPDGLLSGVEGLRPLRLAREESLGKGFPLKLLLAVEFDSEFLDEGWFLMKVEMEIVTQ